MRRLVAAPLAALALLAPNAHAASTALVVTDPTGDANFSELHGQSLPGSQAGFDIKSVTFDTVKKYTTKIVKKKKIRVATPTHLKITLAMAGAPSTAPSSSYGIVAQHSVCGQLRLQIYYAPDATSYGDLATCGTGDDAVNGDLFRIDFTPKIEGNNLIIQVPLKGGLPKEFKIGSLVDDISAYTSTAEPVFGYQPADFEPTAGIDVAVAAKPWKVQ